MCLGIPVRITEISGDKALADAGGVALNVNLRLMDGVGVGDYVLIHAGFAIQKVDEEKASEILKLMDGF